jgi:hypothetical protein
MRNIITETLGWYGVIAIVGAYTLLSLGILPSTSLTFQMLNLTGAIGIVVDAIDDKDMQPAVLNIIWAVIALVAIVKILL